MIVVKPTGVYGAGKTRYYPDVLPHEVDNAWSYCRRLSTLINPETGHFYVPPGVVGTFMYASAKQDHAHTVDAWLYPEEYDGATPPGNPTPEPETPGTGPFRYADLRMPDAQFLNWIVFGDPAKKDAWLRCVNGTWNEICQLSMAAVYAGEFDAAAYSGPLRAVVAAVYP